MPLGFIAVKQEIYWRSRHHVLWNKQQNFLATAKQGDNRIGSVHLSVRQFVTSVCLSSPVLTVWPLTLIFDIRVDLDPS